MHKRSAAAGARPSEATSGIYAPIICATFFCPPSTSSPNKGLFFFPASPELLPCVQVATLFDDDGILIRFMNSTVEGNGIRDAGAAAALVQQVPAACKLHWKDCLVCSTCYESLVVWMDLGS